MAVVGTYIIITFCAIGIYFLLLDPMLNQLMEYGTSRKMLRLELTNDIANAMVNLDLMKYDKGHGIGANAVRDTLTLRQISDPASDQGEAVVLFIEKWLLFDARERKSTYTFYAEKSVYGGKIDISIQFEIIKCIKILLRNKPSHIDLQLSSSKNKVTLIVNKLMDGLNSIDFKSYFIEEMAKESLEATVEIIEGKVSINYI